MALEGRVLVFIFLAVEERYSFDLKSIHCCRTVGITNVIIQLRNITHYSLGRKNSYQKVQRNCCSVVTARNLIKYKSVEKWGMCENVFLLGVTSQGQEAHWIFPTGMKLRSSRLFVSTSFFYFKSLMDCSEICFLTAKSSLCPHGSLHGFHKWTYCKHRQAITTYSSKSVFMVTCQANFVKA